MKTSRRLLVVAGFVSCLPAVSAADFDLLEFVVNLDGAISSPPAGDPIPPGVVLAAFNSTTGLGQIRYSISDPGAHYFGLFLDHEIDESLNGFSNEFGGATGLASGGGTGPRQTWEIDEPGFSSNPGDIFDHFLNRSLDNQNAIPASAPDDVSLAMAWNFDLSPGESATLQFSVDTQAPTSGFYLTHTDPDSRHSLYLSSHLRIEGPPGPHLPDGGQSMQLLVGGFGGLVVFRRFVIRR